MILNLQRRWYTPQSTIGELRIGDEWECFSLEDCVRPNGEKIYGKTAIPAGTYRVVINHSNRFDRDLPILLRVPGFEGIRIHPGNSQDDTSGCILVGKSRGADWIAQSGDAFKALFEKMQFAMASGEIISIRIENGTPGSVA